MYTYNKRFLWWMIATLACMAFIFYKSSQAYAEQDLRPTLATWFSLSTLERWLPHWEFTYGGELITWKRPYIFLEFFIRKGAHVAEYAVLTFFVIQVLRTLRWERWAAIICGAIIAIGYAASDEWHQSFVMNRTGHAIDVAIDLIGVILAVLLFLVLGPLDCRKTKRRRLHLP